MTQPQTPKPAREKPRSLVSVLARWALAVIVTAATGAVVSAQFVIAGLTDAGAIVPLGRRAAMSAKDVIGLAPLYAVFIAIGLAIAFFAAWLAMRVLPGSRTLFYVGAGAVCMLVMLLLMQLVFFGVPIIGGARTPFGLFTQMLCGGLGGYVFSRQGLHFPAHS